MKRTKLTVLSLVAALALLTHGERNASADSVAQVQTAKRISKQTIQLIDPQGGTSTGGGGSNVNYAIGDILTFQIRFTPVENGASRGLGGYITEYVPPNTEVVGARLVDAAGTTVCPHRGGYAALGWGPKGDHGFTDEGGMSALYADTGVFYSTDSRTARQPANGFITVNNGLQMSCDPTGAGQLDELVGAAIGGPWFAHNLWDDLQIKGYGCKTSTITTDGRGNAPFGYGSAVAGPDTFYMFEATDVGGVVGANSVEGPWKRVKTACAEIGTGVPALEEGPIATRVGIPANTPGALNAAGDATTDGTMLSADNPLPAGTNAVRYAVGELVVGEEYLAEISLRVTGAPLDPNFCNDPPACTNLGADINCAEVFGGDASARSKDGTNGGKDNTWRYFLPSPSCVNLGLQFDLDVDTIVALANDTLTYTITAKNLDSINTHDSVVIQQDLLAGVGQVNFVSASGGGTEAGGVITWAATTLAPGDSVTHTIVVTAVGNASPILSRATYNYSVAASAQPEFSVVSLTNTTPLAVLTLEMNPTPAEVAVGGTVRYDAVISNIGTGSANFGCGADCGITVTLPTGFAVVPGTVLVDGNGVGNPAVSGAENFFAAGLPAIAPGGSVVLTFDATVSNTPGVYRSDLETFMADPGPGKDISDAIAQIAPVYVGVVQSDIPTVDSPISAGGVQVCGTSTESDGTTIHVIVDLLEVATTTVTTGAWCATVPTVYAGQDVAASAENTGASEVESDPSSPVSVLGAGGGIVPACNDGADNDSDGQIDFPADPGCTSPADLDETDVPLCSDGIDNDSDGQTDFPDDTGCSNYTDNDESGGPACNDGVDNDSDGQTDFPADTGCTSATDVSEANIPQCANGADDDSDGNIDYPADPGCESPVDDDEGGGGIVTPDAGPIMTPDAGSFGDAGPVGGTFPEHGGVDSPGGGCGCRTNGGTRSSSGTLFLVAIVLLGLRRRRRLPPVA